jgi:hypothetical protein
MQRVEKKAAKTDQSNVNLGFARDGLAPMESKVSEVVLVPSFQASFHQHDCLNRLFCQGNFVSFHSISSACQATTPLLPGSAQRLVN